MKKIFTRLSAVALLAMLSGNAMATDYYLSDKGADTNDGTSAEQAVATLTKAVSLLKNNDVLHVSGFITVTEAQKLNRLTGVTIKGDKAANDGFDGKNASSFFDIQSSTCTLENLTFKDGQMTYNKATDGANKKYGALNSANSTVTITGCVFDGNKTVLDGTDTNGNAVAGAINVSGSADNSLNITGSKFIGNVSAANGGAISNFGVAVSLKNCQFYNNQGADGGAISFNMAPSSTNRGGYTIEKCSFVGNISTGSGAAISVWSNPSADAVKAPGIISYSTFYNNTSAKEGTIKVYANTAKFVLQFANNTIIDNTTSNGNNGAITVGGNGGVVTITNSVIEGNIANAEYRDLSFDGNYTTENATIKNSLVGRFDNTDKYTTSDCTFNKATKVTNIRYAGFGALADDGTMPLVSSCLAATIKGTDEKTIGATETTTTTPADGTICVTALKDDASVKTVIVGRHLVGGQWNSFVVPFKLNKDDKTEFKTYFGDGTKIACMGSSIKDGVIAFMDKSNYANSDIVNGRPYIIKPTQDMDVVITKDIEKLNFGNSCADNNNYLFCGVWNPTVLKASTGKQIVCLGKDGTFFTPEEGKTTIKGLRGYFIFPASENAAKFSIGGMGGTTGISEVQAQGTAKSAKIYTLGGQYVGTDTNNLPQGIYVIGNKKVVVK